MHLPVGWWLPCPAPTAACSLPCVCWVVQEDVAVPAGEALQASGVKLGTDLLVQLSGLVRGGRDSVHAECRINPVADQLSLRKVRACAFACVWVNGGWERTE